MCLRVLLVIVVLLRLLAAARPAAGGIARRSGVGRRRPCSIATARCSTRRARTTARAARVCRPTRFPSMSSSATIAAEDQRFWRHPGVDPIAIARAAIRDAQSAEDRTGRIDDHAAGRQAAARPPADRAVRTASQSRGFGAKIREAVVAIRLEHRLSKREILALYLNLAPYGNQIVGVERASHAYFGTSASQLTVAQAAFLAGLPQRPSAFNPHRDWRSALRRHDHVIDRMAAPRPGLRATAAEARAEQLTLSTDAPSFTAPHFVEMVLSDVAATRPARVQTTLDVELQRDVEGIIRSQRADLGSPRREQRRRRRARQSRPANGSRGRDPATTSTASMAARSTVRSRCGSRARR